MSFVAAKPFKTFWLCLPDGRTLPVDSPHCVNFSPDGRVLTIYVPSADETEVVDFAQIVSLRFSEGDEAVTGGPWA
jgi:hypothetical protein